MSNEEEITWLKERLKKTEDVAEMLWIVIAGTNGGDWTQQSQEWQDAATHWRNQYFHILSTNHP